MFKNIMTLTMFQWKKNQKYFKAAIIDDFYKSLELCRIFDHAAQNFLEKLMFFFVSCQKALTDMKGS